MPELTSAAPQPWNADGLAALDDVVWLAATARRVLAHTKPDEPASLVTGAVELAQVAVELAGAMRRLETWSEQLAELARAATQSPQRH